MGDITAIVGSGQYVNALAPLMALEPLLVITTTLVVPVGPTGDVAVMLVSLSTLKFVAGAPLNVTLVAPVNPVPVIVTVVPPARGPAVGERPVTAGGDGAAQTDDDTAKSTSIASNALSQ